MCHALWRIVNTSFSGNTFLRLTRSCVRGICVSHPILHLSMDSNAVMSYTITVHLSQTSLRTRLKNCTSSNRPMFYTDTQASNYTVAIRRPLPVPFEVLPWCLHISINGMVCLTMCWPWLVPLRKLSTFLKWPQCPLNFKNEIWGLLTSIFSV